MDKIHIRKEIAALINSIKEHSDNIGTAEHIPQLELELILHKIEKLYQKSIVFNHLNSISSVNTRENSEPKKSEGIPSGENTTPIEPVKIEAPKTEVKPVDLFGSELPLQTEKPKTEKKVESKIEKPIEKPIEKTPTANIHKPSITDIRSAIGINDKFQFSKELFGGEMTEYEIAIQQLNTAETIESASEYFMSLQQLYNWSSDNDTVKRLFDLVERRYS